ncbi:MAG: hypothetical protein FOGNACKC_00647 [Anaerolineae bacterium]|nr:hypothetical protein [Anaerolineae bacterium]
MPLAIDHVTIAGSSLPALQQAFATAGLATDYGGPHSNGLTHMSLLGFDDGSYIELISTLQAGPANTVFWGQHIAGDAGPCAWAVQVADVAREAARVAALGVRVDGPRYFNRRRPDQTLVEWDLAFLGDKSAGATLPFIIKDITPRHLRVQPSASVTGGPLRGVAGVVLGVANPTAAGELFRRVYGWPAPLEYIDPDFEARLFHFAGTPVTLAAPPESGSWLAARLHQFDDSPCAYLLGAADFAAACRQFNLLPAGDWFGRPLAWFNRRQLNGLRLGVIELTP